MAIRKQTKRVGRPPKSAEDRLGVQLTLRADPDTDRRIAKLFVDLRHLVPRSAIARAALRIGLVAVEHDPAALFDEQPLSDDQTEKLLMLCWGSIGDAERVGSKFKVWVMSGKDLTTDESDSAESATSFKDALDKLAMKFPPKVALPWATRPTSRKKGSER